MQTVRPQFFFLFFFLLLFLGLWESLSYDFSASGKNYKCVHRTQMPPPEKLKYLLLTPEKLKCKLLTPSLTRTETDGWTDEQG